MLDLVNARRTAAPVLSQFAPRDHQIQRDGLGYARPLTDDEIMRTAPAIYADAAHGSRSDRYAYIPTRDLVAGLRAEGFLPVKVSQAAARAEDRAQLPVHPGRPAGGGGFHPSHAADRGQSGTGQVLARGVRAWPAV